MKVLLINGSPNKEGNTYYALKTCADEIEKNGVETEIFHIGSGPIQGCVACYACRRGDGCVLQDDVLPALVEKVKQADGLIIGSPTYFVDYVPVMNTLVAPYLYPTREVAAAFFDSDFFKAIEENS